MYDDLDLGTQQILANIASWDPEKASRAAADIRASRVRNWVHANASSDYERALQLARSIPAPWYRCQALSSVAEVTADPDAKRALIAEAFASALETAEPNRIVSISAWPLEVLRAIATTHEVAREVERLLAISREEPHSLRRCQAQVGILFALRYGPMDSFWRVLDACIASCTAGVGWRRDRVLRGVATLVDPHSHDQAIQITQLIDSPRFRRQALRLIGEPPEAP
jgi:hypothetical protein